MILLKKISLIIGLVLFTTTAAVHAKKPTKFNTHCYAFVHADLFGKWHESLLVSPKKLTEKQAIQYMIKNHSMTEKFDIEELPQDECEQAEYSYNAAGWMYKYKKPAAKR